MIGTTGSTRCKGVGRACPDEPQHSGEKLTHAQREWMWELCVPHRILWECEDQADAANSGWLIAMSYSPSALM